HAEGKDEDRRNAEKQSQRRSESHPPTVENRLPTTSHGAPPAEADDCCQAYCTRAIGGRKGGPLVKETGIRRSTALSVAGSASAPRERWAGGARESRLRHDMGCPCPYHRKKERVRLRERGSALEQYRPA